MGDCFGALAYGHAACPRPFKNVHSEPVIKRFTAARRREIVDQARSHRTNLRSHPVKALVAEHLAEDATEGAGFVFWALVALVVTVIVGVALWLA